ncbi:MAG: hypothetical protein IPJ94_16720 [Chloroflexi bacterium]|nr:hypothetical protein [Chloroflexota bacterium]
MLREVGNGQCVLKSSSMILTLLASVGQRWRAVGEALLFLALSHENHPIMERRGVGFAAAERMTLPDLGQPGLDLAEGVRLSLTGLSAEPAV